MRFLCIFLVSAFFSLYGASSALAALHVNKFYCLCARFKRGGINFDSIKLGPVFQAKKSNEFTRHSLTNKNHMDYVYSSLMLLLDFDSLQSPSSHPSFLCFANEKVKQNTSLDRQQAWVHESRDARYTGTGKVPVYIIFQTVRYHNFAQFGISYAAVAVLPKLLCNR